MRTPPLVRTEECRIYVNSPLPSAAFRLDSAGAGNLHNPSQPPNRPAWCRPRCARWNFSQISYPPIPISYPPSRVRNSLLFAVLINCIRRPMHIRWRPRFVYSADRYETRLLCSRCTVVENLTRVPSKTGRKGSTSVPSVVGYRRG